MKSAYQWAVVAVLGLVSPLIACDEDAVDVCEAARNWCQECGGRDCDDLEEWMSGGICEELAAEVDAEIKEDLVACFGSSCRPSIEGCLERFGIDIDDYE